MNSSNFREEARKKLQGKWGLAVCITLIYVALFFMIGLIQEQVSDTASMILSILVLIIEVPIAFGFTCSFVKLFHEEETNVFDFFKLGFQNFTKSWAISFRILLKMIVPIILIIISYFLMVFGLVGIVGSSIFYFYSTTYTNISASTSSFGWVMLLGFVIFLVSTIWAITKSYYYQLAYLIAAEKPEMSSKEIINQSQEFMTGKRGKLFFLQLSFIGWSILGLFTLGIGYLWLIPYIQFANIAFYHFVSGKEEKIEVEVIEDNKKENEHPTQTDE